MASDYNRVNQQDTQTPYIRYPPSIGGLPSEQHRRSATRRGDNSEINPKAEVVTSVEGNKSCTGHQAHPRISDNLAESLQPPEADEPSLLPSQVQLAAPRSTSRVRTESDSSGSHSPRTATSPVPGDVEEFVCSSSDFDPNAPRFRLRLTRSQSDDPTGSAEEVVRQELIAGPPDRPRDPAHNQEDPIIDDDNVATRATIIGGSQEPQVLSTYQARCQTFVRWSHPYISKEVLAEAGFIFTGPGDKVKCVRCSETLSEWAKGDDPRAQHRRHFGCDCFPIDD